MISSASDFNLRQGILRVLATCLLVLTFMLYGCEFPQVQHVHGPDTEPGTHPTAYPDRIVATWHGDPSSSFSVTWRTDTTIQEGKAMVAIATSAPKFYRNADTITSNVSTVSASEMTDHGKNAHFHTVKFSDLEPDTIYAYRVGSEDHWSEWFHIRTASKEDKPFSFIYVGDAQNDVFSLWSRAIRAAYSEQPDARFILHAGDLIDQKNRNIEWSQWNRAGGWIQSTLANVAVPGNHEYLDYSVSNPQPTLSVFWRPQFAFPENGPKGLKETTYYLDYQGVRIIGLNSNVQIKKQADWLDQVLSETDQQWIVVTHHHPIFSSGEGRDNPDLRKYWQPLYEKYNVDLVLQGHDHTYARGYAVNNKKGGNKRDPESGTMYVNSVSGPKMYQMREDLWDSYDANLQRYAENTQLFQVIKVRRDTLKYRAYTVTGRLYDAFDLVKQAGDHVNEMIEEEVKIKQRTHSNTIPYEK